MISDTTKITIAFMIAMVFLCAMIVSLVFYYDKKIDCYESTKESQALRNIVVVGGTSPYICGITDKNTHMCYSMKHGCE